MIFPVILSFLFSLTGFISQDLGKILISTFLLFYLTELYQHCIYFLHNYYLETDIRAKCLGVKYIPNVTYFSEVE